MLSRRGSGCLLTIVRMTAFGASRPLPRVAATVCFLITQRALSLGDRNWSSCPETNLGEYVSIGGSGGELPFPIGSECEAHASNSVVAA